MHPSLVSLLAFFKYDHLPEHLQAVSKPFWVLANNLADTIEGAEATVCLRKLLEAKDCAVRVRLAGPAIDPITNAPPRTGKPTPAITYSGNHA